MKIDLMCMSYQRAAENREMVRLKQNIAGYLEIEAIVRSWPRQKPLPYWISLGNIPSISTHEVKDLPEYGVYEIKE